MFRSKVKKKEKIQNHYFHQNNKTTRRRKKEDFLKVSLQKNLLKKNEKKG